VLVNSAAVMNRTPFGEITPAQWDDIIVLNLRAPFFLAQAAAPHLRRAKGAIINIADLAAFETWPAYLPHGISKAGVVHMTRSLAKILAPDVRVAAIAPGTVLMPLISLLLAHTQRFFWWICCQVCQTGCRTRSLWLRGQSSGS